MRKNISQKLFSVLLMFLFSLQLFGCALLPMNDFRQTISTPLPTVILKPYQTLTPTIIPSPTDPPVVLPTNSVSDMVSISMANECRRVIDGNRELKNTESSKFDPDSYFDFLIHLKSTPGYKLDYLYFEDDLGGLPLVYTRRINSPPFRTYDDFLSSQGEVRSGERSYMQLGHSYDYLKKIQIDQSPESYFEFAVLSIVGNQFLLNWHGMYNDKRVLCDTSDLSYIYQEMDAWSDENFKMEFSDDQIKKIEKLDFNPSVVVNDDSVIVRFLTFTKWGGFFENVYTMDPQDPFNLIDAKFNPIIEYDCGISF